jgi:hypothetical protein
MDRQRTFFDDEIDADDAIKRGVSPCDPNVKPTDEKRLSGQNALILQRLRQGPASNTELASLSLKYTSRVSDLRAAGFNIECLYGAGGQNTYRLTE